MMLALSAALLLGDVYLHNPRGSNNKLNEQNNNVQNNNRRSLLQIRSSEEQVA